MLCSIDTSVRQALVPEPVVGEENKTVYKAYLVLLSLGAYPSPLLCAKYTKK